MNGTLTRRNLLKAQAARVAAAAAHANMDTIAQ
ncbi:hypothetical protein J2W42_005447 [Rhizobium tibeticum]|nr:twin-arginine translocation signal domain-containing protein [Rhizobium tibeticum]MDP9812577.1 hypothetical protein [Rhizobium tibeticum]